MLFVLYQKLQTSTFCFIISICAEKISFFAFVDLIFYN